MNRENFKKDKKWLTLILCALLLLVSGASALAKESRIALVIGNGAYTFSPLSDPPNDADLMAERLKALDFTVRHRKNLTQKDMKTLIKEFGKTLKQDKESIGLFYYSGHGMQVGGRNYMFRFKPILKTKKMSLLMALVLMRC